MIMGPKWTTNLQNHLPIEQSFEVLEALFEVEAEAAWRFLVEQVVWMFVEAEVVEQVVFEEEVDFEV